MKNIIITAILTLIVSLGFGQNKEILRNQADFTKAMQDYIAAELNDADKMKAAREQYGHSCVSGVTVSDDDIRRVAGDAAKHDFIRANIERYMALYFPESSNRAVMMDTFICDNGGFEDDFDFYKGYSTTFNNGSTTCNPKIGLTPSVYVPAMLPTLREFEIVTTGTDAITGLQKVKFGNKALKLNDPYSHIDGSCDGDLGVNKIVKRFKVTEENLEFTVWYALALENPPGHINTQPFFSIRCDLAPLSDLCFDSDILKCEMEYVQPGCPGKHLMDVLDWTCHRIKIPKTEIGNIATLEIVMADCGLTGHNGYAYIDGICEDCEGSALGSINLYQDNFDSVTEVGVNYYSCDGLSARICGTFTLPTLCGTWHVLDITVPGYTISNLSVNEISGTFCFDFPMSNFGSEECLDIYAEIVFDDGTTTLPPQQSNTITVCKPRYSMYDYEVIIEDCHDNDTPNLSDDYYYVTVTVVAPVGQAWEIRRKLADPYPGESGEQLVTTGYGPQVVVIGPFFIQEGCWDIDIILPNCIFTEEVCPPDYCSGCDKFWGMKITNIQCVNGNEWTFDIFVPNMSGGTYFLSGSGGTLTYNQTNTITVGTIEKECITYILIDINNPLCKSEFTVCPPKPCNVSCEIEVTKRTWTCNMVSPGVYEYSIYIEGSGYTCYSVNGGTLQLVPSTGIIGPYTTDITLVLYYCPAISINPCADCDDSDCYKVLKIFKPDCENNPDPNNPMPVGRVVTNEFNEPVSSTVKVIPNPIERDMLRIVSGYDKTDFEIIDIQGRLINRITFNSQEHIMDVGYLTQGCYFIRYLDEYKKVKYILFVKL
ncbi:MAG: T9SS type A sorting domain-containing protein [Chitinophagales bacterium]|nr:T9SS type A sorting domain-containing protein [Chitinophagales bacterium]